MVVIAKYDALVPFFGEMVMIAEFGLGFNLLIKFVVIYFD